MELHNTGDKDILQLAVRERARQEMMDVSLCIAQWQPWKLEERSNAFQVLEELPPTHNSTERVEKTLLDTPGFRAFPLPCTLSQKVTGGCLSSNKEGTGKVKRCETRNRGSSRGEGSGGEAKEGSSVPGTEEDSSEQGKVQRPKSGSATCFLSPAASGVPGHFPHVEGSLESKFCFQRQFFQGKPKCLFGLILSACLHCPALSYCSASVYHPAS